jgi:transposase
VLRLNLARALVDSDGQPATVQAPAYRMHKRLQICALAEHGCCPSTIAWITGCGRNTVSRWVTRFHKGQGVLDRPRPGRPRVFTEDIHLKTVAFYCQVAPLPGCGSWTLRWAETHLHHHVELVGAAPSRSSLQRMLKSHALRPHLHRYFLQITDPDFFPKADRLIQLYLHPPAYYFSLDECPGIQALRRLDPHLDADEDGRPHYEGFDYERMGTLDLIAVLAPATGQVFGRCTPNHTTQTFCQVFRDHVHTQPKDAQLHYVMDNLSPHFHHDFCSLVAELSDVTYTRKRTGVERREWLGSEDKRIVVSFTPFHGSWLNMIEIWFGILNQKCLKHRSFPSLEALREAIEAFMCTWNEAYAHPFTWKYTGEGLHAKAVRRFTTLLLGESSEMDAAFLAKQLLLMGNIATDYASQVSAADWLGLEDAFLARQSYMTGIVEAEPGPKRKQRAHKALDHFSQVVATGRD